MLTILPKISNNGEITFTAEENGAFAGNVRIAVSGEQAFVKEFNPVENDTFVTDGLFRAAMRYAENSGAKTMCFGSLNIHTNNDLYSGDLDIKSFFNKNCKNSL